MKPEKLQALVSLTPLRSLGMTSLGPIGDIPRG